MRVTCTYSLQAEELLLGFSYTGAKWDHACLRGRLQVRRRVRRAPCTCFPQAWNWSFSCF